MSFGDTRRVGAIVLLLAALGLTGCSQSEPLSLPVLSEAHGNVTSAEIARGEIQFVDQHAAALVRAREQGKPLMLYFTAPWCRFCNQMANEAFRQNAVFTLSERFVCVLVDADQQQSLCEEFDVRVYPTIVFHSSEGRPLGRVTGKQPSHRLVMEMQSALQTIARRIDGPAGTIAR